MSPCAVSGLGRTQSPYVDFFNLFITDFDEYVMAKMLASEGDFESDGDDVGCNRASIIA